MVSELEFLLNRDSYFGAFLESGIHLHYGAEPERLANEFIDLCVEITARGFPSAVVVAGELAKIEDEDAGDLETSPPRRQAFLRSVPFYELIYENLMRDVSGDPTRELRLDVIEAIFDHPHFRTAPWNRSKTFDRPPTNPALLPSMDYGFTVNPFEEAEDDEIEGERRVRKRVRDDTLKRFVLLPLVILAALVGLFFSIYVPEQHEMLRAVLRLGCVVVGAIALYCVVFWDSL